VVAHGQGSANLGLGLGCDSRTVKVISHNIPL
jgi:hypothetical protein